MSGGSKVDGLTPPGAPSLASLRFLMHMQGPACFCRWLVIVENAGPGHVQFRRRAKPAGLARPGRMRAPPAACRGRTLGTTIDAATCARSCSCGARTLENTRVHGALCLLFAHVEYPQNIDSMLRETKGQYVGCIIHKALHHRLVVALLLGNLLDCTYKSWESRARISDVPR